MLRPISHPHLLPRLLAGIVDASEDTVGYGCIDDFSSVTANGTGDHTLTIKDAFNRKPVTVCTSALAGGLACDISNAITGIRPKVQTDAGSASDSDCHFFTLGYDSLWVGELQGNLLKSSALKPRLMGFTIAADGTVSNGQYQATCALTGTSTFRVTFNTPFNSIPVCLASCQGSSARVATITSTAVNEVVVTTYDAAASETAAAFYLVVLGWDSQIRIGGQKAIVQHPQRKARLLAFRLTTSGGDWTVAIGDTDATTTDDGTGLVTLTYTKAFTRVGEVVASCAISTNCGIATVVSSIVSAVQLKTFNNAASAADPAYLDVFVFGYDDASEW